MGLDDAARRGLLPATDIAWLTDLGARRRGRAVVRAQGGPGAVAALQDYQQAAIELGFLHSRYLRGVAPSDFAVVGQEHVMRMRALRPHLIWPQPSGPRPPQLPPVQPYAWGSRHAIADLQGRPTPTDGPEAELWMGAHPSAPSGIVRDATRDEGEGASAGQVADDGAAPATLEELIAADPDATGSAPA